MDSPRRTVDALRRCGHIHGAQSLWRQLTSKPPYNGKVRISFRDALGVVTRSRLVRISAQSLARSSKPVFDSFVDSGRALFSVPVADNSASDDRNAWEQANSGPLEPPEHSAPHEKIVLPRFARRSQREIGLA